MQSGVRKLTRLLIGMVTITVAYSAFTASAEELVAKLLLPHNVTLSVPVGWLYFDQQIGTAIANFKGTPIDLRNLAPQDPLSSETLIRANSPLDGYASLSLKFVPETTEDLEAIKWAITGESNLRSLGDYQEELARKRPTNEQAFIERVGLKTVDLVGDYPAFLFAYRRKGYQGPVRVEQLTAFRHDGYFILTLAYREAEAKRWRNLISAIQVSFAPN